MNPKLLKRFYEVLVLLRVLDQVQGGKINGEVSDDSNLNSIGVVEMRRKLMYHLCVMCDFKKGGDTVTAIASENLPSGPRYWVAVNGHLHIKIRPFLAEVMEMLETQASSETQEADGPDFERTLFEKFVCFQQPRIKKYWRLLQRRIEIELNRIDLSPRRSPNIDEYKRWLHSFVFILEDDSDFLELSKHAYNNRLSPFLRVDFDPITARSVVEENDSRIYIRHYVGRLCAPMRAAKHLRQAVSSYPFMFSGFSIECLESDEPSKGPSEYQGLTLDRISSRMFPSASAEWKQFRNALYALDNKVSIISGIRDYYGDDTWRPRVHAELNLLEKLYDKECIFYDGDKYIACSKPACFCCYHYICSHPGLFVRPPCHNKLYENWKPPVLTSNFRIEQQRHVMISLTQQVRKAVVEKVLGSQQAARWHPDSSTGITPSAKPVIEIKRPDSRRGSFDSNFPNFRNIGSSDDEDSEDGGVALV